MATATSSRKEKKPVAPAAAGAPAPAKAEKPKTPPKPRLSASDEEIAAAVAGTLTPRDTRGAKDQENLTTTDGRGRPTGRPVGVTTGLPICTAWAYAMQENQKPAGKSAIKTLGQKPDEAITAWMKSEFPGRATPAFDHPQTCRQDYNKGRFTKGSKPKIQSDRFDATGAVIPPGKRTAPKPKAAKETPAPQAKAEKPAGKPAKAVKKEVVNA